MDNLNYYETTFIVSSEYSQDDANIIIEKFNKIMQDGGATITNQECWGIRKLAYPIRRKHSGYYTFTEFCAPGSFISKLDQEYRYDERVLRFLTVVLDKHAIAYNKKRLEQGFGKKNPITETITESL
ncbi:MAG: 30S ribosomal protein S6 [Bacteroidia bacterium]|nr:30S ribosomal protein S6 [Bacteroidia bacterium]